MWNVIGTVVGVIGLFAAGMTAFFSLRGDVALLQERQTVLRAEIDALKQTEPPRQNPNGPPQPAGPPANAGSPLEGKTEEGYAVVVGQESSVTACGVQINSESKYAARYDLPCGSKLSINNMALNRVTELRVLDRAGSSATWQSIVLGLSPAAAAEMGISGRAIVRFTVTDVP